MRADTTREERDLLIVPSVSVAETGRIRKNARRGGNTRSRIKDTATSGFPSRRYGRFLRDSGNHNFALGSEILLTDGLRCLTTEGLCRHCQQNVHIAILIRSERTDDHRIPDHHGTACVVPVLRPSDTVLLRYRGDQRCNGQRDSFPCAAVSPRVPLQGY